MHAMPADPKTAMEQMLKDAEYYHKRFSRLHNNSSVDIVATDEGYDININGIEVGSYGFREIGDFMWVYGTGLAEPRFSQAVGRVI
jgi:hypothetical protein